MTRYRRVTLWRQNSLLSWAFFIHFMGVCELMVDNTPRIWDLERFPIECRKTKTKVITLANHNSCK